MKGKFLIQCNVHSGNVAMENGPGMTKMYLLLKTGIFHCYVSLPVGSCFIMDDQKKNSLHEANLLSHLAPGNSS